MDNTCNSLHRLVGLGHRFRILSWRMGWNLLGFGLLLELIAVGLAGYRIANLLVYEDGPVGIFEKIRNIFGVKPGPVVDNFWTQVFTCMYCMTVWTTVAAWGVYQILPEAVIIIAAMSVALIADRIMQRDG